MAFQTINPTTNKLVQSFDAMTAAATDDAIAKAATTFDVWKTTDYAV
jgi:succinate-semialdehyde dehydrogenase/glutarate-semialdehyde dehydrogenase